MGLSYLRSNPLGGGTEDDPFADPGDSGPVDLSALLSPEVLAHRRGLPNFAGAGGTPPAPLAPPAPPTFGEPGPQGLFPAQGKVPISAPADDNPDAPPGNDLLSRFASRLGGFGSASTDDDRKQALRQAMIQAGLTLASNAGTHGTAALAPALLGGFATYRGGVEQAAAGREHAAQVQAAEDDRRARLAMDKGRYADEAQLRQDALQDRRDQVQGKVDQRQARLDQHKAMLAEIAKDDPKTAAKLAPLVGSDSNAIETAYMASLKPEKPPKGPQLRDVPAGSALVAVDEDGTVRTLRPAAHIPGTSVNLGWALERQSDGSILRINKNTGEVAPVNVPVPTNSSPAALGEERRKTAAGLFSAMNLAGTVPLGPDGNPDVEAGYQRALEAADRIISGRRNGALAPGVTPPPPKPATPAPKKPTEGPGLLDRIGSLFGGASTPAPVVKAPPPPPPPVVKAPPPPPPPVVKAPPPPPPPVVKAPPPPPPPVGDLNPGGIAKTRAILAHLSPAAARQKLLSTGLSPAMVDAYIQAAGQ